jgi:hypothetical protein
VGVEAGPAPGPDAFGYTLAPTTVFSFVQITNGSAARVLAFNDDADATANIGFSFNFYGTNYTTVSFSVNGLMSFNVPSGEYSNVNLTATPPTNNQPTIAVLWDDWETQETWADAIYYKTSGTAPNRQFIVQWNKLVPVNGDGTNTVIFEARLFEGNNRILFSYLDAVVSDESTAVASLGVGATVGIRDKNGQSNNRNLQWSFNQAVITNGLNLLFTLPNHAPVATSDFATTFEDTPVTINVLSNDSDQDGDALAVVSVTQGANGVVVTNGSSTVKYSPAANFFGADSFTYTVSDSVGGSATGVVSVTVSAVNDPPTLSPLSNLTVDEGAGQQFVNLAGISSGALNENDTLSVTATSSNLALIPAPTITYTSPGSTGTLSFAPVINASGSTTLTVTVNDGMGSNNIVTRSFAVTVIPVNHPPVAGADTADAYQDTALKIPTSALLANDTDSDSGDILEVFAVAGTNSSGRVSLSGGTVIYIPAQHFIGRDTFAYTVTDGHGGNATGTVSVTIWPALTIRSISRESNGHVLIRFQATPGKQYAIEACVDLGSWSSAGTATETSSGNFEFEDGATDLERRFYRLSAM